MPGETIRAYGEGDEAAILELFARSFHQPRTRAHWEWKYRRNPWGNGRISEAFDAEGALVGHYCGYPVPFYDRGIERLAHQIGDTMTAPHVRHIGRGRTSILGRAATHFYDTFCAGQVAFNYGFNVANIQRFSMLFLNATRVEPVTYRVLARPVAPIGRVARWMGGYQLEIVRDPAAEFDRFFDRVKDAYGFLIRRDARYIRWRYLECPDVPYVVIAVRKWRKLAGWIAIRIRENRLSWGDALFDPACRGAIEVMLRHIVPGYPVEAVEAWFPPRPKWFHEELERLGFETKPEPQELSLMCVPFTMSDAVDRMRSDLYYTMGDSDLY